MPRISKESKDREFVIGHAHRSESSYTRQDWHKGLDQVLDLYPIDSSKLGSFSRLPLQTVYDILSYLELQDVVVLQGVSIDFYHISQILQSDTQYLQIVCQAGFLPQYRFNLWLNLLNTTRSFSFYEETYLSSKQALLGTDVSLQAQISRDIDRTFPSHAFFREQGRSALQNLLTIFSLQDSDIGYTQGMNYLAGHLLLQSNNHETKSFFVLIALLHEYDLRWTFLPGLPQLNLFLFQFQHLLDIFLPSLSLFLTDAGLTPSLYAVEWFVTIFAYSLPQGTTGRVWDLFLLEGWKVVFQVGLAVLCLSERDLRSTTFEGMIRFMKDLPSHITEANRLIRKSLQFKVTPFILDELEEIYIKDVVRRDSRALSEDS